MADVLEAVPLSLYGSLNLHHTGKTKWCMIINLIAPGTRARLLYLACVQGLHLYKEIQRMLEMHKACFPICLHDLEYAQCIATVSLANEYKSRLKIQQNLEEKEIHTLSCRIAVNYRT